MQTVAEHFIPVHYRPGFDFAGGGEFVQQAGVLTQIVRALWCAGLTQIGGRSDQLQMKTAQLAAH
ncbi:hypothetical protein D3C72_1998830 [compost metagenome]